jgi:UDP-glucose 6-dehydrogenase
LFNLCGFGAFYTKGRWEPLIGFVLISVSCFNRAQIKSPAELVRGHYSGNGAIGILGLTYKPDMDVVEEAFGLLLAQELLAGERPVLAHPLGTEDVINRLDMQLDLHPSGSGSQHGGRVVERLRNTATAD